MKNMKEELLKVLGDRPLLIWGCRMTGIGFVRFARTQGLEPLGFVDSDKSMTGKTVMGLSVRTPDAVGALAKQHRRLLVVIAVSIKEDEIADALTTMGVADADFVRYSEYSGSYVTIDVVGTCNLRCPSCAYTIPGVKNPTGFMSLEKFKAITAKMQEELGVVSHIAFYSWGEPLLHKGLDELINHAHDLGIATAVSSHLSIPVAEQFAKLVKAAPDYLKVSLSGFYPEVYDTTHTRGDVNLVKSNLYRIRYLMDKYKVSMSVEVNYHLYRNNVGKDLEKMQELCDELGFVLSPVYANITPVERLIDYKEGKLDKQTTEFLDLLLVSIDKGLEIAKPYNQGSCRFLSNQLNIHWDGSIPICCVTFDRKTSTIADDYLTTPMSEILDRKKNHPICAKCTKYDIPPYLLGVNQKAWKEEADRVIAEDRRLVAEPKTAASGAKGRSKGLKLIQ